MSARSSSLLCALALALAGMHCAPRVGAPPEAKAPETVKNPEVHPETASTQPQTLLEAIGKVADLVSSELSAPKLERLLGVRLEAKGEELVGPSVGWPVVVSFRSITLTIT